MTSIMITRDGKMIEVICTAEVAHMLQSEETDNAVKELIVRQLVASNCQKATGTSSDVQVPQACDTSAKWTKAAEKLLLEEHKKIEDRGKPVKNRWQVLSNAMKTYSLEFTAEQCRLKFRGLKEKYERQKKKSNTSGEAGGEVDTQLEDCFESLPDIKPIAVLDTDSKKTPETVTETDTETIEISDDTSADVEVQPKKRRRSGTAVEDLKTFLKNESDRREAATERRHKEKLEVTNSLVSVLRDLAKK